METRTLTALVVVALVAAPGNARAGAEPPRCSAAIAVLGALAAAFASTGCSSSVPAPGRGGRGHFESERAFVERAERTNARDRNALLTLLGAAGVVVTAGVVLVVARGLWCAARDSATRLPGSRTLTVTGLPPGATVEVRAFEFTVFVEPSEDGVVTVRFPKRSVADSLEIVVRSEGRRFRDSREIAPTTDGATTVTFGDLREG